MEDAKKIYMGFELIHGNDMAEEIRRLQKAKTFTEKDAAKMIHQVLLGLNYMHASDIIHRDIKPENVMIHKTGEGHDDYVCKITDFGLACKYDHENPPKMYCGSFAFIAPEILEGIPYDTKVDVWALGVMTYNILTGKLPYLGKNKTNQIALIRGKPLNPKLFKGYLEEGKPALDFIERCLTIKPKNRAEIAELLNHRWIKKMAGQDGEFDQGDLLQISHSLDSIVHRTSFQSGFINFLVGLKAQQEDVIELGKIFTRLDKN